MRVRLAVAADLAAIADFDRFGGDRAAEVAEARCLVADDDGAVGYMAFRADGCVGQPFVTYLAIAPSHRRRGLARTLIAAVADRLGPRLFISTETGNAAMLALLTADGWRAVGEIRAVNASGAAEVFFVKSFG